LQAALVNLKVNAPRGWRALVWRPARPTS